MDHPIILMGAGLGDSPPPDHTMGVVCWWSPRPPHGGAPYHPHHLPYLATFYLFSSHQGTMGVVVWYPPPLVPLEGGGMMPTPLPRPGGGMMVATPLVLPGGVGMMPTPLTTSWGWYDDGHPSWYPLGVVV
ncbi:unnamed protein product [Linum trigynum]|uniref:Uncharacterized protein n=1 Tax=Linum trigynum TaxID=586398 RepID=A0AAV2CH11_9ROSI